MMFQLTFAIITVALLIGGIAERMKLRSLIILLVVWMLAVYLPVAHWVWGGGWIFEMGALDFAGGTVVHITAGVSALAAVMVLGKRLSASNGGEEQASQHPLRGLGWRPALGRLVRFQRRQRPGSNALAVTAMWNTMLAGSMAAMTWGIVSWLHLGRPGVLGLISGAVAGLVAITPAAGYVDTTGAMIIGLSAGVICYGGILLRKRFKYDDALDVFGVHGVGGTFGAIATGLLATSTVNSAVVNEGAVLRWRV